MAATTLQAVYSSAIAAMTANVLMMPPWCGSGPAAVPRFAYRFRPKSPGARSLRTDPAENGPFRDGWHHHRAASGDISPCNTSGRRNSAMRARKSRLYYASPSPDARISLGRRDCRHLLARLVQGVGGHWLRIRTGFVAAANIGTYTCAASMDSPGPSRLREHEGRS